MWPQRAEPRGCITSLNLLAMLFLMLPRTPFAFLLPRAHSWLMDNFLSTRTPRSFSELLSTRSVPSLYMGLILSRCRTLHLPLLNFRQFSVHLSNLSRCFWRAAQHSGEPSTPPRFVLSNQFPWPSDHALFDAVGFPGCKSALLSHIQFLSTSTLKSSPVACHWVWIYELETVMKGFQTLRLCVAQLEDVAVTALSLPYLGSHMQTDSLWLPAILSDPAQNCSYSFAKYPTAWTVKGQYFVLCFHSF